jgi:hypothetical protein
MERKNNCQIGQQGEKNLLDTETFYGYSCLADALLLTAHICIFVLEGLFLIIRCVAGIASRKKVPQKAAEHWWLTPVILAIWEDEIGRILV